jgi:hypothetical protein
VGYRFAVPRYGSPVDVERVIGDSISAGRDEPDLFWALVTWLTAFGDLVNIHRLWRMVPHDQTHVAGAAMELAVDKGADKRLSLVAERCKPLAAPELLFTVMRSTRATEEYEREHGLPLFSRWGLLCSSVTVKDDALTLRSTVLKENPNLALRAIFGPGARADVLFALMGASRTYIQQIANTTGFSYQPVHAEVRQLERNGLVSCARLGTATLVTLSPAAQRFLKALPV